jgi:hypothetical protein
VLVAGIVDVVHVGAVGGAGEAAADDMDLALGGDDRRVVARLRQRRQRGPGVGRGIVDLVGGDGHAVRGAPTDRIDLAAEHGDAYGAAALLHRGERAPTIQRRIIFEHEGLAVLVHRGDEAADGDDLAAHHSDAHVVEPARHRIAAAPMVGAMSYSSLCGTEVPLMPPPST